VAAAAAAPETAAATPMATSAMAATAAAAMRGNLDQGRADAVFIEEMEGCQTDVGDLFFTESEERKRRLVLRRHIGCGEIRVRPAARHGQGGSGYSQHRCGFAWTLRLRSALDLRHAEILPYFDKCAALLYE
jgi:hypothetical protein